MCQARSDGVSFRKTILLGRQNLYVDDKTPKNIAREFNIEKPAFLEDKSLYSEEFFRLFLSAEEITSLDYSDYEGADINHDMIFPIPEPLEEKYDVIIDGGTLQHVFNFSSQYPIA